MTVATAIRQGTELLEEAAVPAPKLTAEVLLSHALRKERVFLFTHPELELPDVAWIHYGRYLHERLQGKPTQYITKHQEFYGREFSVGPHVLIPRPETEFVVEEALRWCADGARVVDVGVGSGAIAVTLALESRASVVGVDLSEGALRVARCNASRLSAQVGFLQGGLLSALGSATMDVIVSNPPYVAESAREGLQREVRDFEPSIALFGGPRGTEIYERLFEDARRVLRPRGRLVVELGFDSLEAVSQIADGWKDIEVRDDLAGIPRVFSASL